MKIVWLAPYPIKLLIPEIKIAKISEGHPASWIVNLSDELKKNSNIELHIITSSANIPYSQEFVKDNINFHVLKYNLPFTNRGFPAFFRLDKFTWYKGFVNKALQIIDEIQPDLIHAYGTEKAFALIACESNFPAIVSIQGIISEINKVTPSFDLMFQIKIEKYVLRKNMIFGCRTHWDRNIVNQLNPKAEIYYVPEAVNPLFFNNTWQLPIDCSILFVGAVIKRKGVEVLLKACGKVKSEFPDFKLKIIGNGKPNYIFRLKKISKNLEIEENVIWMGSQGPKAIASELSRSTLFVLPTFIDNSPNSLAESMAVGTPSIASNVGGVSSMIKDKYDGVLAAKGDSDELAQHIIELMKDNDYLVKLSKNAKQIARIRNKPEVVAKQTIDVYQQIIKKKNN